MKTELPLVLELAEAKMIAGDLDIQLSSKTSTTQQTKSYGLLGVVQDVTADVAVDDVIA
ncbi:hypothetical protein ACI784_12960 [Geodermatophilus sp. SYSU D01186]